MQMNMIRMAVVSVALLTGLTKAAERVPYAVTIDAVRKGDNVMVSVKITETLADGKTKVISAPRVTIRQGQRGEIVAGDRIKSSNEIESGVRVEIISVRGKDELLVVAMVMEKGEVAWAEASKSKITQESSPKDQPPDK